ncbi:hypothetical protein ACIBG8_40255 [Nonomuraea sp. NPDC050556]|uniref:hypothetical protein n=1 Tax=Nonomuraea sp. NPDC050556 TaxID=3364369 RepID=UPI0037BBC849
MLFRTLERVGTGVAPGLVIEPDASWTPVTELLREPYGPLLELVDETATRWNAPRHVGAALWWKTYTYWHSLPMALGWAIDGRVPVMRLADTYVKSSPAGVTIGASRIEWGGVSLEEQAPLVEVVSKLFRIGERTLWGSTAEAFAHPLTSIVPGDYMRLLRELGLDGLITPAPDGFFRRTCCLWITLPDVEPCSTCCVFARN